MSLATFWTFFFCLIIEIFRFLWSAMHNLTAVNGFTVFITMSLLSQSPIAKSYRLGLNRMDSFGQLQKRVDQTHGSSRSLADKANIFDILQPAGKGQSFGDRLVYHEMGLKRRFKDPQVWTHAFFFIAGLLSGYKRVYDLFALLLIVSPLSLIYHVRYEKPGRLAYWEGIVAKMLFAYGFIQIFRAPTSPLLFIEAILASCTVLIFVITNVQRKLYDPWHALMHVVPSLWACIVSLYHTPLIAFS